MLNDEARHEMLELFAEALKQEGKELGSKLGISATMVSQVKNGRSLITTKIAQKLCGLMNQPELLKRWEEEKSQRKARTTEVIEKQKQRRNGRIDLMAQDLEMLSEGSLQEVHEFILSRVNKQKKESRMRGVNWHFEKSVKAFASVSDEEYERRSKQDDSSTLKDCICRFGAEWIGQYIDFKFDDLALYSKGEKELSRSSRAFFCMAVAGYDQKGKQEKEGIYE